MGGLLAFRVGNFDNTAEREQFRFLCEQLKAHYENSNDFCVIAGNYNIGCELDALFIKKDAIIAIEFKNYGGKVVANENGEWTCDGQTIKGGSRKTVLQQARVNHSIVKKELKVLGVGQENIKDVPTLIVFNQAIELANNLSSTTKSWLHITDNVHFLAKLDDITCPRTDLSPLGIVNLAELLNLNSFYLEEFSNATYEKPSTNSPNRLSIFEDIKESEKEQNTSLKDEKSLQGESEIHTDESDALKTFVSQILSSVLNITDAAISILDGINMKSYLSSYGICVRRQLIVKVDSNGIGEYCSKLSRFMNREVRALTPDTICWQDGEEIEAMTSSSISKESAIDSHEAPIITKESIKFHKFKTVLPHWLDLTLFNQLEAVYSPEYEKFEYNLNLDENELKVYLGTYFPRSYAEAFCVFDGLFQIEEYRNRLSIDDCINILDFGCGTAGELVGLIVVITKYIRTPKEINILAVDGNACALDVLKTILEKVSSNTHHHITIDNEVKTIKSDKDLSIKDETLRFNFIMNSKMVCELISRQVVSKNAYFSITESLTSYLAEDGIFYVLDVTTKDAHSQYFYPQLMNKGINEFLSHNKNYSTILPLSCRAWRECNNACFMQQSFGISHSRKSSDESRVCYRLICYNNFLKSIFPDDKSLKDYKHIIHPQKYRMDDDSSLCPKSTQGEKAIDTYNLKL